VSRASGRLIAPGAQSLRPFARRLTGVDLSKPMVERARASGVHDLPPVAEVTAFLGARDTGRFDLIASCDTFICFGDLRPIVTPAARRLAVDGAIAFTVERSEAYPFKLTDSGRFAHHRDLLCEIAQGAGLSVLHISDAVIRYEHGQPVAGLVAVFGRRAPQ
jgi:predicted TPR repeat methyltransferase